MDISDNLGPHSPVEEIESEKILALVMLDTLDPADDEFYSRKQELESKLQHFEQLLGNKNQQPTTPSSNTNLSIPGSANLPSRSRPSLPNPYFREPSPVDRIQSTNSTSLNTYGLDADLSESSQPSRKRHRQDTVASFPASSSKLPRTDTRPATSSTSNSYENSDDSLPVNGTSLDDVFETYRRKAEQQEARFARERQDEALARQLSQQPGPSNVHPESNQGQAQYIPQGSFVGPARSASDSNNQTAQQGYFGMPETHGQHRGYGLTDTPWQHPTTPSHMPGLPTGYHSNTPLFDGNDDLSVISPEQFGASSSSRPLQSRRIKTETPNPFSYGDMRTPTEDPAVPGAFPSDTNLPSSPGLSVHEQINAARQRMFPQAQQPANPFPPNPRNTATASMRGSDSYPGQSAGDPFIGFQNQPGLNDPRYHGQAGASVFGNQTSTDPTPIALDDDESDSFYGYTRDQLNDLHSRNWQGMLSDPNKTKEEIVQLLENIRPDEELPPHLREGGPTSLKVALMEHQKLGLSWLKKQEESKNKGSILADDMGLGKTIQALALMLERPSQNPAVKTNLIVAPVALMRQWKKEIATKVSSKRALSVHIYHGSGQKTPYKRLAQHDIVLTTYGTLGQEWKRLMKWQNDKKRDPTSSSPKPDLKLIGDNTPWYRVILDEAQAIKNKNAQCAWGAFALRAEHRLAMTGTPMMNHVQELFSLVCFLKIQPYCEFPQFQNAFRPLARSETTNYARKKAMERLQILLRAILLRRMKTSQIDGKPILNLKERIVERSPAVFDDEQRKFYEHIQHKQRLQFNKYLKAGTIGKNYSNILVLLLRMRQACDHPHLINDHGVPVGPEATAANMEDNAKELGTSAITRIKEANGAFECPICYDAAENPTIFLPCGHDVCSECFTRMTDSSNAVRNGDESTQVKCPECRTNINTLKILTYNLFKKVHMPEEYKQEFPDDSAPGSEQSSDLDSDSDSDFDSDSDADDIDNKGNLRNFIVPDDEVDDEENVSEKGSPGSWTKIEHDEAGEDNPKAMKRRKSIKKGKAKAKSKEPKKTLAMLKKESMRNAAAKKRYLKKLRKDFVSSAKIDKTLDLLKNIRENDPTEKTIIFSQFTSFLDLLEIPIYDGGWKYVRYDGSMNAKDRNEAVEKLADDPNCNVMLISLKAGNAGLNLNFASQVIILDPFWNPFIEEQAIDRAHRIGQMRDVNVHRILIEGTVEDRIVALQERKRELINVALDEKKAQSLSRLGREELMFLFGSGNADHD